MGEVGVVVRPSLRSPQAVAGAAARPRRSPLGAPLPHHGKLRWSQQRMCGLQSLKSSLCGLLQKKFAAPVLECLNIYVAKYYTHYKVWLFF